MESCGPCAGEVLLRAGLSHELVVKVLEYLWSWPEDATNDDTKAVLPVGFDEEFMEGDNVYNNSVVTHLNLIKPTDVWFN